MKNENQNSNPVLTRWYADSRYMKETGTTTYEYTWVGGDAYSAPVLALKYSGYTVWVYVLRDYLGNITHITNSSGGVLYEYNYDAWGRRRDKDNWSYTVNDAPEIFAGRGFTGHEFLPWFNLYNMNGRMYDPVVGRFLSPDNYVQNPDFSQSYNRYSYALNNPLIYTDPSGDKFTLWHLLAGSVFGSASWSGIIKHANGEATIGQAIGAYVTNAALFVAFAPIGGGTFVEDVAWGAAEGAIGGGINSAIYGEDIGKGMLYGAGTGAVFAALNSENMKNLIKGQGFYNNENVFNNFAAGKYSIPQGSTWQQEALNYFGFEGTYTGTTKGPSYVDGGGEGASFFGSTNPQTGNIKYGDLAFNSYDKLKMTYNKEMYHSLRIKNGIPLETQGTEFGKHLKYYPEERLGFIHAYKNQGLYPSAGKGLMGNISFYQMQSFNLNPSQYYYAKWWHFIYKIPRRW